MKASTMKLSLEFFQAFTANMLLRFTVLFTKKTLVISFLGFESLPVLLTTLLTISFLSLSIYDKILSIRKAKREAKDHELQKWKPSHSHRPKS